MDTNTKPADSVVPAWQIEGLPGRPVTWDRRGADAPKPVPLDALVRDTDGKVITVPRRAAADMLIIKHIGAVETVEFRLPGKTGVINDSFFADVVAFRCDRKLSWRERHAAATLAWLSNNYYPPMERQEKTVLPGILDGLPGELRSSRPHALLWKSFTEEKAYQVADVLEKLYYGTDPRVFEDGDGWFVAIKKEWVECESMEGIQQMEAVLWILSCFDIVPTDSGIKHYGVEGVELDEAEAQEYLDGKARRAMALNASHQRIEDGINAILAHLGHPEAEGRESIPPKPGKGLAALIPPTGKPSGKGKPKVSA